MTKNYTATELARMLSDAANSNGGAGIMPNFVFSQPLGSESYDSLATTMQQTRDLYQKRYVDQMAMSVMAKRRAGLSAAMGLGSTGTAILGGAYNLNPSFGMNMLGHHGGYEAIQSILGMGGAFASARVAALGGFSDPYQLSRNMAFAATQGARAYKNNFNSDGTINIDQTKGLNLQEAAIISGNLMGNRSVYTSWADKELAKGYEKTGMKDADITRFRDGVGATKKAQESFNEYIKNFSKEINGFVSSVSKMTGSFDEAINFMQKMTGGKLYSAESGADEARKKAARMAMNIRVSAADAGIDAKQAYALAGGIGQEFNNALGITSPFFKGGATSAIGGMNALAFNRWKQANPGATEEEQRDMQQGLAESAADYAKGDMVKMVPLLAMLKDQGKITEDQANSLTNSGDAEGVRQLLSQHLGGKSRVSRLMNNGRYMQWLSEKHEKTARSLHENAAANGLANERDREGAERMFRESEEMFRGMALSGKTGKERMDLLNQLNKVRREATTSEEALKASKITAGDAEMISAKAKKYNWSSRKIEREITKRGGDIAAYREARDTKKMQGYRGMNLDKETMTNLEEAYGTAYAQTSEEERRTVAAEIVAENMNKEVAKTFQDMRNAKTPEEKRIAQERINQLLKESISGVSSDGGRSKTQAYNNNMIESFISSKISNENKDKTKIVSKAMQKFEEATKIGGLNVHQALAGVQKGLENDGVNVKLTNKSELQAHYDKTRKKEVLTRLMEEITRDSSTLTEEDKDKLHTRMMRSIDNFDRNMSDESNYKKALTEMFGSLGEKSVDITEYYDMIDQKTQEFDNDFLEKSIKADAAVAKSANGEIDKVLINDGDRVKREARRRKRGDTGSAAVSGFGSGSNDANEYYRGKYMGKAQQFTRGTNVQINDETAASRVAQIDERDAKLKNKVLGRYTDLDLKVLRKKYKVADKVKDINDEVKKSLDEGGLGPSEKRWTTEMEVSTAMKDFLEKHGGESEEELRKSIREHFKNTSVTGMFDNLKNYRGISIKSALTTMAAGATEKDRNKAQEEGFLMNEISAENSGNKSQTAEYLNQIMKILQDLSPVLQQGVK